MKMVSNTKPVLSRRKKVKFTLIVATALVLLCLCIYVSSVLWRCSSYLKRHSRWVGSVYRSDPEYGYFPRAGAYALHVLRGNDRIPVQLDADGFRIPATPRTGQLPSEGSILFLGCSFTHGYGVPAEHTFAQRVADKLGARCLNGGVSGWGYSQMVLRARHDIARFRPKIVVVQYSNWLVSRSQSCYGPSDFGAVPTPFVFKKEGAPAIHAPVFRAAIHDLMQRRTEQNGLLWFSWQVGLPLLIHDDFFVPYTSVRQQLGLLPVPLASRSETLDFALEEIRQVCATHGSRMIVVMLRNSFDDAPQDALDAAKYSIVDTFEPLAAALPERTATAWAHRYYHWRGIPPRLVDMHPGPDAHAEIARAIIRYLKHNAPVDDARVN